MKISNFLSNFSANEPFYTFEFFPPKTEEGLSNLYTRLARMSHLHPRWVHITWGAGGSTKDRSLELAQAVKEVMNENIEGEGGRRIEVCLHLTCTNIEEGEIEQTISEIKKAGIENILALRGDPPRGEESWIPSDPRFQHAVDLVRYLKAEHGDYFCVGVAGYPEGWSDTSTHQVTPEEKAQEMSYLKQKVDAGADFVVTQLFYDVEVFRQWYKDCRTTGISVPILPGIMPIQNYATFRRITKLCKVQIPSRILGDLDPIATDDAKVKQYGVQLAVSTVQTLWTEGIRGFHFCTLNLERSTKKVLEELGWIDVEEFEKAERKGKTEQNKFISTSPNMLAAVPIPTRQQNGSAIDEVESILSVSPAEAINETRKRRASVKETRNRRASFSNVDPTEGDPRQEGRVTWDEFPNGRFGDARSPAYGEIDGWGVSLKMSNVEGIRLWGYPEFEDDISKLFIDYLKGKLASIPWSDEPILSETSIISSQLESLNKKGWWTIASQPTVDGCPSSDPIYGFGPPGGYIFQKAFVELFICQSDLERLIERIENLNFEEKEKFKFFSSNRKGDWKSNMADDEVNAVTWAAFDGKEIATTTLIEQLSFKAWNEEAFALWEEWERLYPQNSKSRELLRRVGDERWLISIVHHDYKDSNGLWNFLLST